MNLPEREPTKCPQCGGIFCDCPGVSEFDRMKKQKDEIAKREQQMLHIKCDQEISRIRAEMQTAKTRIEDSDKELCLCCKATRWEHSPEQWSYCRSVIQGKMDAASEDGVGFAASLDGWVSDSALSVIVGTVDPADQALIDTTQRALDAGIAAARPGNKLGDISAAIGEVAHAADLTVNLQFGGHGVGRTMHGEPHVANDGRAGRGLKLKPGLVIAIEPWFLHTTDEIVFDPDGWTIRSADGSRGAHTEHTIAVTDGDPIVLTARD